MFYQLFYLLVYLLVPKENKEAGWTQDKDMEDKLRQRAVPLPTLATTLKWSKKTLVIIWRAHY